MGFTENKVLCEELCKNVCNSFTDDWIKKEATRLSSNKWMNKQTLSYPYNKMLCHSAIRRNDWSGLEATEGSSRHFAKGEKSEEGTSYMIPAIQQSKKGKL